MWVVTMFMADDEWRVSDLLDESQPVVADAKLAKQVVEVLANLGKTDLRLGFQKQPWNLHKMSVIGLKL